MVADACIAIVAEEDRAEGVVVNEIFLDFEVRTREVCLENLSMIVYESISEGEFFKKEVQVGKF